MSGRLSGQRGPCDLRLFGPASAHGPPQGLPQGRRAVAHRHGRGRKRPRRASGGCSHQLRRARGRATLRPSVRAGGAAAAAGFGSRRRSWSRTSCQPVISMARPRWICTASSRRRVDDGNLISTRVPGRLRTVFRQGVDSPTGALRPDPQGGAQMRSYQYWKTRRKGRQFTPSARKGRVERVAAV